MQVRKNQQIHTFVIVQASNSVGDFNLYLEVKIIQNAYINKDDNIHKSEALKR